MKALLVTREQKRPIGIVDVGPQAEDRFRMCQTIEIHTAVQSDPAYREADASLRLGMSETHPFVGSYMRDLGETELLTIFSLRSDTEKLLSEYFGKFASGDHSAIVGLKINTPIFSILGYLRR